MATATPLLSRYRHRVSSGLRLECRYGERTTLLVHSGRATGIGDSHRRPRIPAHRGRRRSVQHHPPPCTAQGDAAEAGRPQSPRSRLGKPENSRGHGHNGDAKPHQRQQQKQR